MPDPQEFSRAPKASRVRVWQAVERIVRSGRRPTVEGVRELLGGGSPNSVTAYVNEWYQELGNRLTAAETPMPGLPHEAVSLLAELWRVAARSGIRGAEDSSVPDELRDAERAALVAETKALDTLNRELQRHRASAEKSLAEARALLARREAALEEGRSNVAALDQALAQARLELEIALERQRLAPSRMPTPSRKRSTRRRPKTPRGARMKAHRNTRKRKRPSRRVIAKNAEATRTAVTKRRRAHSRINRRTKPWNR